MQSAPRRSERQQRQNLGNSQASAQGDDSDDDALDSHAASARLARRAVQDLAGSGRQQPAAAEDQPAEDEASDEEASHDVRGSTPPRDQQATLDAILRAISQQSQALSQIQTRVAHIEGGDSYRPRPQIRSELPEAAAPRAQFPLPDAVSGDPSTDIKYLKKPPAPNKEFLVPHHPENPHKLTKLGLPIS